MTLVLNGQPFIEWQYECFKKLSCDWKWIVIEGAAQNGGSTSWCKPQEKRISTDGTIEYLRSIQGENVVVISRSSWDSKDEMVNTAITQSTEPCVLLEIDSDEIHTNQNIDKIVELFANDSGLGAIKMLARYFVGPNLICEGKNCWSNNDYEWLRAWRFEPGMSFTSHEPPVMNKILGRTMEREEAASHGLTFDHLSWVRELQVKFKSEFYGGIYSDAVHQWKSLQANQVFPVRLARFFPWVSGELPLVRKI
jgi:hypothetical protein